MFENIRLCVVTNRFFDEEYIEEYCEHYYNLGFTYIYILEDLNGREERFIDMPYIKDKVDNRKMLIEQIPHQNQWSTYKPFYEKHKDEFDWCAIFDSDEFLKLNKHNTIQEYINDPILKFDGADSIQICWRYFGDNGKTHKEDGGVVDRFTELCPDVPRIETKIIIRGGLINTDFFIGHAVIANGNGNRIKFSDGTVIGYKDPFHKTDYSYASLDHYFCKSTEEYIKRKSHGRLDIPGFTCYRVLNDAREFYFQKNERTEEKEKLFDEALEKLR